MKNYTFWTSSILFNAFEALVVTFLIGCSGPESASPGSRVGLIRSFATIDGSISNGVWLTPAEIATLPTSGAAYNRVLNEANSAWGAAHLDENTSNHDVKTLAGALIAARTGDSAMKNKVIAGLQAAMSSPLSRALELSRGLQAYIIAADLIGYRDPAFVDFIRSMLTLNIQGHSGGSGVVGTAVVSANNWGCMARATSAAAAGYLNDHVLLARIAQAHREFIGVPVAQKLLVYSSTNWHADSSNKAGINRKGATINGLSVDGVIPEDMRRTGEFEIPIPNNTYPWEAIQGEMVAATILHRMGVVNFSEGDYAMKRAMEFLLGYGFAATGDDSYIPWVANKYMGTSFATSAVSLGEGMGFTDWTHSPSTSNPSPSPSPSITPTPTPTRTAVIVALADATINSFSSGSNYGASSLIKVDKNKNFLMKFDTGSLGSGTVNQALLRIRAVQGGSGTISIRATSNSWSQSTVTWATAPAASGNTIATFTAPNSNTTYQVDIKNLFTQGSGIYSVRVSTSGSVQIDFASRESGANAPTLAVTIGGDPLPSPTPTPSPSPSPTPSPSPSPSPTPTPGPVAGLWTSPTELSKFPMSGKAWDDVKTAADSDWGDALLSCGTSFHDVNTLAGAIVYARTGNNSYCEKVITALVSAVGTESEPDTVTGGAQEPNLALSRNLASYVLAADLIQFNDSGWRSWLSTVRTKNVWNTNGRSLNGTQEDQGNNWGTNASASRIAADFFLGDAVDLDRAIKVFRGYLGDRSQYASFGDWDAEDSWHLDPTKPIGINPKGAKKIFNGVYIDIDGAQPEEMRRGAPFRDPPTYTGYP